MKSIISDLQEAEKMTDLIKMDIYRLVHSKSFKVGLLFSIIIPLLVVGAMGAVIHLSGTEIRCGLEKDFPLDRLL